MTLRSRISMNFTSHRFRFFEVTEFQNPCKQNSSVPWSQRSMSLNSSLTVHRSAVTEITELQDPFYTKGKGILHTVLGLRVPGVTLSMWPNCPKLIKSHRYRVPEVTHIQVPKLTQVQHPWSHSYPGCLKSHMTRNLRSKRSSISEFTQVQMKSHSCSSQSSPRFQIFEVTQSKITEYT